MLSDFFGLAVFRTGDVGAVATVSGHGLLERMVVFPYIAWFLMFGMRLIGRLDA